MTLLRPLLRRSSPAGGRGRLSVLIFHRVHARPDPLLPGEVDAIRFDRLCGWLRGWFNVLPLDQAVQHLRTGSLPERAAAITFDDGYADNHDVAMPILRRHGLTATFFIATGYLDGGRMWNDTIIEAVRASPLDALDAGPMLDQPTLPVSLGTLEDRRRAIDLLIGQIKYLQPQVRQRCVDLLAVALRVAPPTTLMMSADQVRSLSRGGMQIGAHTVTHPILRGLPESVAAHEIGESRRVLEHLIDQRVGLFAYPNGKEGEDFDAASVNLLHTLGFDAAVTTHPGFSDARSDRFRLPRYTPWQPDRLRFGLGLWRNLQATEAGVQ